MDATELRPLTLGELLDRTFRLYRNHFWLFVGIMAIPSAFTIPFSVLFFSFQTAALVPGAPPAPKAVFSLILFALIFLCVFGAVYSISIGATTYAVSESYMGQKITVRGAYGKVRGFFWRIIGVMVVAVLRTYGMLLLMGIGMGVIVFALAGTIAVIGRGGAPRPFTLVIVALLGLIIVLAYISWIVFGILWGLRYAVSIPALLLERLGALAALRRSVQLTRGRRWPLLLAIFLCTMIAYVGIIVFQGPFFVVMMLTARSGHFPEWLGYASGMSSAVGSAITGPVLLIALVLSYYDTRIRKEAFDLQFMMSALDQPAPAPGAGSPV